MTVVVATQSVEGPDIQIGYPWTIDLYVDVAGVAVFPSGATFKAEVRRQADSAVLATLTTANGYIGRLDDNQIRITIPASSTAAMVVGNVTFDVARTDTSPATYVGLRVTVPVTAPFTQP